MSGLIFTELQEIRKMAKDTLEGKMTPEMASLQIGFFNQTQKRVSQIIQIMSIAQKEGRASRTYKEMVKANILSGDSINLEQIEEPKIKCFELGDKLISREQCLEFSGNQHNMDKCQQCEQFELTRNYCLKTVPNE